MSGPNDRHHPHDTWSAWYPDPQSATPMWVRDCLVPECRWRQGSSTDPAVAGAPPGEGTYDWSRHDRHFEYVNPIIAKARDLVADPTPELVEQMRGLLVALDRHDHAWRIDFHNRHASRGT